MTHSTDHPRRSVRVGGVAVGGQDDLVIMAGPCAIESIEQVEAVARFMVRNSILIVRGGAFKPRTSPYAFQGLGEPGLKILRQVADRYGLRVVSEVMDTAQLDAALRHADLIQVGARSMSNTCLLKALGEAGLPVLLKRGFASTLDEFLLAAEHIRNAGNEQILLCERGIRTFETSTRFTLDLAAVMTLKQRSDLPVVVDPSHAAGDASLVPSLAMAATAAGADALLLEVHPHPERALCDSKQALGFEQLEALIPVLHKIRSAARGGSRQESPKPRNAAGGIAAQTPLS